MPSKDRKNRLEDQSDTLKHYRIELPNLIDDLDLSVWAFRLYSRLKRIAGGNGSEVEESTRQLAEHCKMSVGQAHKAKKELEAVELIKIETIRTRYGPTDKIILLEIWSKNFEYYSGKKVNSTVHSMNSEEKSTVHSMNATPSEKPELDTPTVHSMNATAHSTPTVHHMNGEPPFSVHRMNGKADLTVHHMNVLKEHEDPEKEQRNIYHVELALDGSDSPPDKTTNQKTKEAVKRIFAYWQKVMDHPRAQLTPEREAKIRARLQIFTEEQICQAIDGCRSSKFHMGDNPDGTVYDSINLICQNGSKLEEFIQRFEKTRKPERNLKPGEETPLQLYTRLEKEKNERIDRGERLGIAH